MSDYCDKLQRSNPGTTIKIESFPNKEHKKEFKRVYICLATCKKGFKDSCRQLIRFDGCYLKGDYGGHLLSAIGIDVDNGMYTLAISHMQLWSQSVIQVGSGS